MSSQAALSNKILWEWTAQIHAAECELGSTFSVIIFIGNVPSDPEEWLSCPEFVGKYSVLVGGRKYTKRIQGDNLTEGFVHLNVAVAKRSGLGSLDPEEVVPYLEKTLNWRVQKVSQRIALEVHYEDVNMI